MPLTPEDVRNKLFTTVRLREGYEQAEVDEFLDEVEAELIRLLKENDDLRLKLTDAGRGESAAAPAAAKPAVTPEPETEPEPERGPEPVARTAPAATAAADHRAYGGGGRRRGREGARHGAAHRGPGDRRGAHRGRANRDRGQAAR